MTRRAARRLALAVVAGGLLYAGHPPLDWGAVVGPVALLPLLALARDLGDGPRAGRRALGWGFIAGATAFAPLLYWLIPFGYAAWGLLTVVQAAAVGAFAALMARWGARAWRPAVAAVAWVGVEAVRSAWPLGGFTWGVLAYTQHDGGAFLGAARTFGTLGVSLALAAVAAALEEAVARLRASWPAARTAEVPADAAFRAVRTPLLAALVIPVVAVLAAGEAPAPTGRTLDIAAVQADDIRYTSAAGVTRLSDERIRQVAGEVLDATAPLAADPPDLVVWPENSLDADPRDPANAAVRDALAQAHDLLGGTPILAGETADGPRPRTGYNQMTVFTPAGIGDVYRKRQLVPFGEYVPGRRFIGWLPPLRQIPTDLLPGTDPGVISIAGARIGPVICFENTFPHLARDQVVAGAEILVVSTNNSSFGDTPMSRQHLAFSQVRAVETGRWVLHAGISGISGLIDPAGNVRQRTGLFADAIIRADVPLLEATTPAVRLGDALGWATAAALLPIALWPAADRRRPDGRAGEPADSPAAEATPA